MIAILSRRYGVKQTTGCLYIFDEDRAILNVKTLELPYLENQREISCIPSGEYDVELIHSLRFGDCFSINDVPDRDGILIHRGNFVSDTRGCILVGMRFVDINDDNLAKAMKKAEVFEFTDQWMQSQISKTPK